MKVSGRRLQYNVHDACFIGLLKTPYIISRMDPCLYDKSLFVICSLFVAFYWLMDR